MIFGGAGLDRLKSKIGALDVKLSNSFSNVRADIDNLYSWIDYLKGVSDHHSDEISALKGQMSRVVHEFGSIREAFSRMDRVSDAMNRIESFSRRMESLEKNSSEAAALKGRLDALYGDFSRISGILESLEVRIPPAQASRPRLQQKVMRSVARSSKEFIRSTILGLIRRYSDISALKLREIIVEEQGIASKSTFYRILEELDSEGSIEMVRVGKEKHYFSVETKLV